MASHDTTLVAVALAVCLLGCFTTFSLSSHALNSRGRDRSIWLLGAGTAAGGAIWATHFIAMLALDRVMPMEYHIVGTGASIAFAILGSSLALSVGLCRSSISRRIAGGLMLGASIATMHITGMNATTMTVEHVHYLPGTIAAIVVGMALTTASLLAYKQGDAARRLAATLFLMMGVASVHFGSMASMQVHGVGHGSAHPGGTGHSLFATVLAGVVLIHLLLAQAGQRVARKMDAREKLASERLRSLANMSLEGILVVCHDGIVQDSNERVRSFIGESPIGNSLAAYLPDVYHAIRRGEAEAIETDLIGADMQTTPVQVFVHRSSHLNESGWVVIIRDLTERREAETKLRHVANHDPLTGLPNRALFLDRLQQAIARTTRSEDQAALLYIDLDGFKVVNDLYGHARGDMLLRDVARILKNGIREGDTVARIGGDEFVIIQEGSQPRTARITAARLIAALAEEYGEGCSDVMVGMSIGVAVAPHDTTDPEELIRLADVALYRAKADGKNTVRFFEREMDEAAREQRQLDADLRASLRNREISLAYQPQMNAATGEITGFEALARWNHPIRGSVPPDVFIPLAEQTGFITDLGAWVLHEACREAASWAAPLRIAVNLSAIQVQSSSIVSRLESILTATGLDPARLELEITETAILSDREATVETLTGFKALGVTIAMDDFGTGYSSLSSLQSFPFDKIKVDKSFVAAIEADGKACSIVKAVIGLGRSLDLPIVAEGVETEQQLELLRAERCTEIQGYLVGRPRDIVAWSAATGKSSDQRAA
ncbi:bifunctional diguanylate cyclase/phosphodiesterase [Sphingomonas sp. 3-13AW]|uniref:bifunctional diguanylate cyclase/phosphodiesterase n=1 Tax=Sphingomonas sp. 3-13AW TaxID=3050450 RepID=UPI003BB7D5E6